MNEIKLNGESKDIIQNNVSKLKEIFPEIVTEDKIDFDKLKLILGNNIDENSEKYNFTWPGKIQAIKESQKTSSGTLRPCKEESKNWDSTQNLYIEGDNLEALKLLQKSYNNKIKTICIDPPYNTGKDFIYKDNYKDNLENYLKLSGQVVKEEERERERESIGIKLSTNTELKGKYHSNWLNMMYSRLKLAKNLLSNQGTLFINIGDKEVENLKKLCNEIFGEENTEIIIWEKVTGSENAGSGKMKITKRFRKDHEYVIICYKSKENTLFNKPLRIKKPKNEYGNIDNDPRGNWMSCEICKSKNKSNPLGKNYFQIETPSGMKISRQWHFSKIELKKLDEDNRIYWGNGNIIPRLKKFLNEPAPVTPSSVMMSMFTQTEAINSLKELNLNFDNPKPINLIKWFLEMIDDDEFIVLDFFSGSATTAHATIQLNSEDDGNRKFIMVQLPEIININSKAYKSGYKNICEIGKERIRRAGDKILEKSDNKDLDIGFKVFKLDSSNLEKWDPDYDNLEQTLLTNKENIKPDRTELDLIYEIMLKYGIDLTLPIEKINSIYSIGYGALLICLEDDITKEIAKEIIKLKSDNITRVVFKESGFKSDADKTNIKENLRINNINEFITI